MPRWKPKAVSLFSGLGGMDIGFNQAGMQIVLQADDDPRCIETLCLNKIAKKILRVDLRKINGQNLLRRAGLRKDDVDVVFGGPSCQPFSRSNEGRRRGLQDPRGQLILDFSRIVRELKPKAFVMENVRGLVSSNGGQDLALLERRFLRIGYHVNSFVLNAADYGVPQTRHRVFLVGLDDGRPPLPPTPTHSGSDSPRDGLRVHVTSQEAIGSMDDGIQRDGATSIGGIYGYLVDSIPPGMNYLYYSERYQRKKPLFKWRSKFWTFLLKMDPERPSHTIQASPGPYVGPFHWRNRRLTLREVQRIQCLPESWKVSGESRPEYASAAWRQIGDAVPPPLAAAVAGTVKEYL